MHSSGGRSPKNCPLPWGDPSRNLMVPPESKTQTASRSVHLFVVTDRHTQTMTHDMRKLLVPRTHNKLGDRSFSAAGPRLWNDLPPGLRRPGLPSTPSDNLWKLIYLATEALSDSFEFICAIEISLSIYLHVLCSKRLHLCTPCMRCGLNFHAVNVSRPDVNVRLSLPPK